MNLPFALPHPVAALPLGHWGVIRATGADAASFLQGQLTNDVAGLSPDEARLAGFCSAKGRLQASFVVWREAAGEILLACDAGLLAPTLKRLSMFVLRAKCRLTDATSERPVSGSVGSAGGLAVWQKAEAAGATRVRLPDAAGVPRLLEFGAPAADGLPVLADDLWRWLEVQSGVATIGPATVDRFVPQMLNFELLGGVDFQKGCYPGQEVVARSQYRGTLKRRTFLFDVDAPAAAGEELWHSDDPAQPAGLVVNAAAEPGASATFALLAEVKLAALGSGSLSLRQAGGPVLRQRALPYAVPLDRAEAA